MTPRVTPMLWHSSRRSTFLFLRRSFLTGNHGDTGTPRSGVHARSGGPVVKPLIIEARINEYAPRSAFNPNVPYTPQEIAEDAKEVMDAGASIVHFHARDDDGSPAHSTARYVESCRLLKELCGDGILVHPTLGYVTVNPDGDRLAHIRHLCSTEATRPDFAPLDMGSINVDRWDADACAFRTDTLTYTNSTKALIAIARGVKQLNLKPYLVAWSIGFSRTVEAFMKAGLVSSPAFLCFCLTDGEILSGHPGTPDGIQAHIQNIPSGIRSQVEWTACNFGGSLLSIADLIIEQGGHVSIGLGDYPYNEGGSSKTNADLIRCIVDKSKKIGRPIASPLDAKRLLGML